MDNIRVRFAPSPTGALHIGGVRTALYNYLLARRHGGTFILRIEDTDQTRYVPGAEQYIIDALKWCGIDIDEGTEQGGDYGPYRQSDRKAIYKEYTQKLVDEGKAYYAFDTPEELTAAREAEKEKGNHTFKYDATARKAMRNSESMSADQVAQLLEKGHPYTIRLKVPVDEIVEVNDLIRGKVQFQSNELDDKVLMKADGMPTYHLANVVDDYLMKITHVIRGEEWLPSTAHHVLLYQAFGWTEAMPSFSHLPLILKPTGKGKLSKRDGLKLGIPVFPLGWEGDTPEDSFLGFKEFGFDPRAVVNFLAFLGWNPGTEQELFSLEELTNVFSIDKIGKSGARFDYEKARWFNQQYILQSSAEDLLPGVKALLAKKAIRKDDAFVLSFIDLMKERVVLLDDFVESGYYFFADVKEYEGKMIRKKWKQERIPLFNTLKTNLLNLEKNSAATIKQAVLDFMEANKLGFGDVLPILRIGLTGTMKGPDVFGMMALLGKEEVDRRLEKAFVAFDEIAG